MVSNIYVSDDSGRIRIALWGDHAPLVDALDIDTGIQVIDAYSKSGFNDEIELSVGNRSRSRGGGYCTGLEFEIESIVTAEL
jgi:replication factor A1